MIKAYMASRALLTTVFPYLRRVFMAMIPVETTQCPAPMAVDSRWRLYWNPEKLQKYCESETNYILLHEACHCFLDHCIRNKDSGWLSEQAVSRPVPVSKQKDLWAIAVDVAVNYLIDTMIPELTPAQQKYLKPPDDRCTPERFDLPPGLTVEAYFRILLERCEKQQSEAPDPETQGSASGSGSGQPDAPGTCMPEGVPESGSCADGSPREYEVQDSEEVPAVSDKDQKTILDAASKDTTSAMAGKMACGILREAQRRLEPPQIPWQTLLRSEIASGVFYVRGNQLSSFSRINRRQGLNPLLQPGRVSPRVKVAEVIDTSGSMQDEDLQAAIAETEGILKALRTDVSVFTCDSESADEQRVHKVSDINLIGGGGTDMGAGIEAAMSCRPKVIVIITDGITPWPEEPPPGVRIITVLTRDTEGPPFGKTIKIKGKQ